jgi:hypothetical protein
MNVSIESLTNGLALSLTAIQATNRLSTMPKLLHSNGQKGATRQCEAANW